MQDSKNDPRVICRGFSREGKELNENCSWHQYFPYVEILTPTLYNPEIETLGDRIQMSFSMFL